VVPWPQNSRTAIIAAPAAVREADSPRRHRGDIRLLCLCSGAGCAACRR